MFYITIKFSNIKPLITMQGVVGGYLLKFVFIGFILLKEKLTVLYYKKKFKKSIDILNNVWYIIYKVNDNT